MILYASTFSRKDMKAQEFIHGLLKNGRFSFTTQEAEKALSLSSVATRNTLLRLKQNKKIASPARGFYLILPPEYEIYECLPADMFIDSLMKYFNQPYYVGYLSAAQFHGAAHQKPQRFQVVTLKNRRPIRCGRIYIEFIANKDITDMPTKKMNTYTGYMNVATPEVTAADLVNSPQHGSGISNVATVLIELAESLDERKLIELTMIRPESGWIQRLGYLFDFLGLHHLANVLFTSLQNKKSYWIRLIPRAPKILSSNEKWKIIINTEVEPDDV